MMGAHAPARGWWPKVPSLAGYLLAEGEEEALEDQHGASAAQDGQGLARKEAEDGAGKGRAQEALQHPLKCREGVPGASHVAGMGVPGLSPTAAQLQAAAHTSLHCRVQGQCSGTTEARKGCRIRVMLRMPQGHHWFPGHWWEVGIQETHGLG